MAPTKFPQPPNVKILFQYYHLLERSKWRDTRHGTHDGQMFQTELCLLSLDKNSKQSELWSQQIWALWAGEMREGRSRAIETWLHGKWKWNTFKNKIHYHISYQCDLTSLAYRHRVKEGRRVVAGILSRYLLADRYVIFPFHTRFMAFHWFHF
jgi:hypothetical protein